MRAFKKLVKEVRLEAKLNRELVIASSLVKSVSSVPSFLGFGPELINV